MFRNWINQVKKAIWLEMKEEITWRRLLRDGWAAIFPPRTAGWGNVRLERCLEWRRPPVTMRERPRVRCSSQRRDKCRVEDRCATIVRRWNRAYRRELVSLSCSAPHLISYRVGRQCGTWRAMRPRGAVLSTLGSVVRRAELRHRPRSARGAARDHRQLFSMPYPHVDRCSSIPSHETC